jgi:prephenate dehydrogenase
VQFRKITIVGVGLLGGSVALAVRQRGLAAEIAGYVRRDKAVADCERFGATDYATTDLLAAASNADLVILGTPLAQMRGLAEQFLPALKPGTIVTDVGSVKAGVARQLEPLINKTGAFFIGSHPMAGGEKTGLAAARPDLFENSICALTPTKNSPPAGVRKLTRFWRALGARVVSMDAAQHDVWVGRSSHLPHVVAAALAALVLDPKQPREQAELCATGFRDTTRIASGSPEMWRDIALANGKNLSRSLDQFAAELKKFQAMLRVGDAAAIETFFTIAKSRRDLWCANGNAAVTE